MAAVVRQADGFALDGGQSVEALGDGGFRLTTSRYYTPNGAQTGESIDKKGIAPDVAIPTPALTDAETKSLNDILNGNDVKNFAKAHPTPSEAEIAKFVTDMHAKGNVLSDRYLRRLVRTQLEVTNNNPPLYDLDFDIVMQAAVKAIQTGAIGAKI